LGLGRKLVYISGKGDTIYGLEDEDMIDSGLNEENENCVLRKLNDESYKTISWTVYDNQR
jgi:hypothetical protein